MLRAKITRYLAKQLPTTANTRCAPVVQCLTGLSKVLQGADQVTKAPLKLATQDQPITGFNPQAGEYRRGVLIDAAALIIAQLPPRPIHQLEIIT